MRRLLFNKITIICIILFSLFCAFTYSSITFANDEHTSIVVGEHGSSNVGLTFISDGIGNGTLWYPGYSASSILRIKNNYETKIKIQKIGMSIFLSRNGKELAFEHQDAKDYMNKMLIKIDYKNPLDKLIRGNIFDGDFSSFRSGSDCSITIAKNKEIDLIYTIKMDESTGNNTEEITAQINFTIDLAGDKSDKDDKDGQVSKVISDTNKYWAHEDYPHEKMSMQDYRNDSCINKSRGIYYYL